MTVPEVLQETGVVAEGGCPLREGLMTGWQAGRLLPAEVTTEAEAGEGQEGRWEAEEVVVETVEKVWFDLCNKENFDIVSAVVN